MIDIEIKKLLIKIELYQFDINKDDMWCNRFLDLISIIKEINEKDNIKEYKINNVIEIDNLIQLYKKTENKRLKDYLFSLPGMTGDFENIPEQSYMQHGFISMQYDFYNKKKEGIIQYINNYETFIFFDRNKDSYCMNYLSVYNYYKKLDYLKLLISTIEKEKIVDVDSLKIAEMLLL